MSAGVLAALTNSLLGEVGYALFSNPTRMIDTIIPDVVISESGRDQLQITDHPVEIGATVSDHAFKRPAELEMRCGFSDSTGGYDGYSADILEQFLNTQGRREPFEVSTGKRQYKNMLVQGLSQETNAQTEHSLIIVVSLREVIITETSSSGGAGGANAASQGQPSSTAPEAERGVVSPKFNSSGPVGTTSPTLNQGAAGAGSFGLNGPTSNYRVPGTV